MTDCSRCDALEDRIDDAIALLDRWPVYAHRGDSGSKSLRRDVRLTLLGRPLDSEPIRDLSNVIVMPDGTRWAYEKGVGWQEA